MGNFIKDYVLNNNTFACIYTGSISFSIFPF